MNKNTARPSLSILLIPLLLLVMTSCRGMGGLIKQPLDKIDGDPSNGERVIDADFETVVSAARSSIPEVGLELVKERKLPEGGLMLIGKAPVTMWSNGGYARVVVLDTADARGVTVRVLTLTKSAMNVTAEWNYAPKIFAALESRLSRSSGRSSSRRAAWSDAPRAAEGREKPPTGSPAAFKPAVAEILDRAQSEPTREFDRHGARFRYPSEFTIERDDETEGVELISLEGADTLIMLQAYEERVFAGESPSAVLDLITDLAAKQFRGFDVDRQRMEIELAGEVYDCRRMTISINGVRVRQEYVALDLRGAYGVLMLQGTLDDSGAFEPESVGAFELLGETFELES